MKILKLRKEKLDLFASVVQQFGELHAPVEQDGKYAFKRLTRWSEARLEYDRTILPPKKYFFGGRMVRSYSSRASDHRVSRLKTYIPSCSTGACNSPNCWTTEAKRSSLSFASLRIFTLAS